MGLLLATVPVLIFNLSFFCRRTMSTILGTYCIPTAKHLFFIGPPTDDFSNELELLKLRQERRRLFEIFLKSKDLPSQEMTSQWRINTLPMNDFLSVLQKNSQSYCHTSNNPMEIELLTLNHLKTLPYHAGDALSTTKVLGVIPDEDIIEVFL